LHRYDDLAIYPTNIGNIFLPEAWMSQRGRAHPICHPISGLRRPHLRRIQARGIGLAPGQPGRRRFPGQRQRAKIVALEE